MKKISLLIITLSSFIFSQNLNTHMWSGTSVSTSDNLDAMGLNPAGLGVNRGEQFAIAIKQIPFDNDGYIFTYSKRNDWGLGLETSYNSFNNDVNHAIGYGTSIINNLYFGAKYSKNNYSFGILFRPHNGISLGLTNFKGDHSINVCDDDGNGECLIGTREVIEYPYNNARLGFAIRPLSFLKTSNKFLNYSNLTIGYDKTMNNLDFTLNDDEIVAYDTETHFLNNNSFQEKYFMSLNIIPGINLSYYFHKDLNDNRHGLSLSFQIGKDGVSSTYYPSNSFYNTNSSNTLHYYNYSQNKDAININDKTKKYIKMNLEGYFIEEKPTIPFFQISLPFMSTEEGTQLKSWIDKIDDISKDENIEGVIINLGNVKAGFSKRRSMFEALMRLKNNGKKIIVYTQRGISNSNYHLISMADEIYTHRMSSVDLKGLSMEPTFLRGLLDTLSIVPEVIRVSPYKTAADGLLNRRMSKEMEENYSELLNDMYEIMVDDISKAKNWEHSKTKSVIDNGPYLSSIKAIESELISGVMFPDEFDDYIDNIHEGSKVKLIDWNDYLNEEDYLDDWKIDEKSKIAVIYAVGGIVSGNSNPGPGGSTLMGDKTIMKAIKDAREDDDIKAIVLRVDSGGGSALASDMMWKEVFNTTESDSSNIKPFIVSMSDVAASGGYYIACQADKIVADESTITGSIGVIWARINFTELMSRIGINSDKILRGENADFGSGSHLLTEKERQILQENIVDIYNIFKQRVVDGRDNINDIEELDNIALGRVWSGKRAKELGLVDVNGDLYDAIDIAKSDASISTDEEIEVVELPKVKEFNLFDIFSNETNVDIEILKLKDLLPEDLAEELEALEIIPVIMDNEIQFLMPYKINFN